MLKNFNKLDSINLASEIDDKEKTEQVKQLQANFEYGKISRRNFMQGALALGVSMGSALSLVDMANAATPKKAGDSDLALLVVPPVMCLIRGKCWTPILIICCLARFETICQKLHRMVN